MGQSFVRVGLEGKFPKGPMPGAGRGRPQKSWVIQGSGAATAFVPGGTDHVSCRVLRSKVAETPSGKLPAISLGSPRKVLLALFAKKMLFTT